MARQWPFFRNLIADVEMVLAKADLGIASRYAELAGPRGARIFSIASEELERTRQVICAILETDRLLEREPVLARAIELRNPYVDPMSHVQVELLRRWRRGERRDASLERALFTTVKGIARGLQNTG
jgi:phosphoenolpyruvate carboxylase